jgi:hypothetical protein
MSTLTGLMGLRSDIDSTDMPALTGLKMVAR